MKKHRKMTRGYARSIICAAIATMVWSESQAQIVTDLADGEAAPKADLTLETVRVSGNRVRAGGGLVVYWSPASVGQAPAPGVGGGGGNAKAENKPDRAKDACAGNPVRLSNGNKIETELDFAAATPYGLMMERTFVGLSTKSGVFGPKWHSILDMKAEASAAGDWPQTIRLHRPSGDALVFELDGARWRTRLIGGTFSNSTWIESIGGRWVYRSADGSTEVYSRGGSLLSASDLS
ncbi:hypothetical protein CDN99_27415 [Roseateles aquatilis]|uniref:DUF6531 domain-containing protein n=1 Tax=Roseateles aquatilis TaxID=431061 RepID=A0A246ISA1_9BURK|nr:DUF6531 domain-containing protein [Roseateles aquatilis]OWQ83032.1 hypothetical protein CDN99_27415 [Roseateles aquatilis]